MEENKVKENENSYTVEALLEEMNNLKIGTISIEDYNKLKDENGKLVKELANNRPVVKEESKQETREDVISRCKERTASVGQGSSLKQVKALCENYRDMQLLGMDVGNVDENVVLGLENLVEEAKGDDIMFTALMESRIKVTK